jgi:adenosylmethionine-8-amino-7-oxononanoate aminotransferase
MTSFWHPFSNMAVVAADSLKVERGEGVYVFDADGKRYLDGTASLWYTNIGYGRTEIAEAVAAQITKLHAFHTFGAYTNQPAEDLASRIASVAPVPGSKVFLTSGGSDSVDTAAKLARRYFTATGQPERTVFIVREWAYHGMHAYGTSLAGIDPNKEDTGPLVEDVVKVPYDSIEALEKAIGDVGADRIAGLYAEPVIGAGGVRPVAETYLKESRSIIRDAGALYIADEVVTGFGRCGDWFASNRFSLDPDLVTFAKGVTSGYAPLGGVIASPRVAEPFWTGQGTLWRHGYTYSGHSASCVAALVNLEILEREGLLARALELESELMEVLEPLTEHPLVAHIRGGVGVLAAIQLDPAALAEDPTLASRAARAVREAGVITRAVAGGGLQASPPLIITREQLDELAAGFEAGIEAVV